MKFFVRLLAVSFVVSLVALTAQAKPMDIKTSSPDPKIIIKVVSSDAEIKQSNQSCILTLKYTITNNTEHAIGDTSDSDSPYMFLHPILDVYDKDEFLIAEKWLAPGGAKIAPGQTLRREEQVIFLPSEFKNIRDQAKKIVFQLRR